MIPQRKSPRATFHDYSGGEYFITICTYNKEHYFGTIHDGEMHLSEIGYYAQRQLEELHTHYKYIEIPLFVVMPNHIHAIVCINEHGGKKVNPQQAAQPCGKTDVEDSVPRIRTALSVVVGGYKQAVTMFARRHNIDFGWQSRYHDHIIRGNNDGSRIADYIINNVARWDSDCFFD